MLSALKKIFPGTFVSVKRLLGLPVYETVPAGEKGPDYYDRAFEEDDSWRAHFTESHYYFLWTVLIDRLRRTEECSILEIGCGSGQLAAAVYDAGLIKDYMGFDFSEARVGQARIACPDLEFDVADAFETNLYASFEYDTVISTEFLEHVERDLDVLIKLRPGTRFLGTVPNFPWTSHVRHFDSCDEVRSRYRGVLDSISVVAIPANSRGKTFFVIEGVARGAQE